ncbi:MAG: flagellar protein FliS [Anaeromyxobacteraceae bacterium]
MTSPPDGPAGDPSPSRLAALLLETALGHIRAGASAMEAGHPAAAGASLREAARIIVDLHTALDREGSPELSAALAPIYRRVCQRLNDAALLHDADAAREAEQTFGPIAAAFQAAAGALDLREAVERRRRS